MKIKKLIDSKEKTVLINGWVKNNRSSNKMAFLNLNDGSTLSGAQVVCKNGVTENFDFIKSLKTFSSVSVEGELIHTPNGKQDFEILAKTVKLISSVDDDFPIQNKKQTLEFLRENLHLRTKTTLFSSIFKIRSEAMFAIEEFFNSRDFIKVSTPIITENDAEGAGETFTVTTIDNSKYENDFFGKKASLTVSGQLAAEAFAQSFSNVYTFGPTFRAENSNTVRHIAEFWMLEPEMAFSDLKDGMDNSESLLLYVVNKIFSKCKEEIIYLDNYNPDIKLLERIEKISISKSFERISYRKAIEILIENKNLFEEKNISFGLDLGTEHEKFLAETYFKAPVFIYDYPKSIKSFYMHLNDDNETVGGFDLLVPGVGELVGGSQRETRLDVLRKRSDEMGVAEEDLKWYFDLRRFGMAPSTGYGLGFERLVMLLTGMNNIKDTIPFPRSPRNIKY